MSKLGEAAMGWGTMRLESTAEVVAECKLKYYIVGASE